MTEAAVPDDRRRFWRTLLIFGLVGPYIGLALALLVMTGIGLAQGIAPPVLAPSMASVAIVSAVFAIPFGGVPAVIAGLAAVMFRTRGRTGWTYYLLCAVAGGIATAIIPMVFRSGFAIWIPVGAATALICAWLTRQR